MSVNIPVAELCSFEHTDDCYVLPKDWNRGVRQNKWQGGETAEKRQVNALEAGGGNLHKILLLVDSHDSLQNLTGDFQRTSNLKRQ